MNYTPYSDGYGLIGGTCLQGYVKTTFDNLVKAFGQPGPSDGYKSDAEWIVKFDDGTVVTIYNWKNGKNYCGDQGLDVEDIREWNVGGHDKRAPAYVGQVLAGVQ